MELTRQYYRAMIFYDIKLEIIQEESRQRLQLTSGNEAPSGATVLV